MLARILTSAAAACVVIAVAVSGSSQSAAAPKAKAKAEPAPVTTPATTPTTAPAGAAVFPSVIAPAYAKESAGVGRRKTCLDQYRANKATNANGGLKWIQKGGGYYSQCTKKLKGAA